nr:hypothetical protein [Tanacetum cinerariifolium]
MPPRVMTRSAGQPVAESRGGETGVRIGRGRMGRRPREGNDECVDYLNGQGNDQGMGANGGVEGINGNVEGANGGASTSRRSLPRESWECDSKWKLGRMVVATEPQTIQKAVQISGALTDEAVRNGSIKKIEKRRNVGEPSKDKSGHLAKDCKGVPRNVNLVNARNPTVRACSEFGSTDHIRSACPRLNRAQGLEENHPNQVAANNGGQGHGNQGNQTKGKAFMLGAKVDCQDPNIMTGTFTLNNHFATTLFDSGADYGFVSTTFIPLLGIEPSDLGFQYEIKIASGQLVEIDKVFPDDLSGLSLIREIELISRAVPIIKSPYRLHLLNWRSCPRTTLGTPRQLKQIDVSSS